MRIPHLNCGSLCINPTTPNQQAMVATCYLDDSGIEETAPVTVLAGCVLGKDAFLALSAQWSAMLRKFRINSLHMKDFIRPHGKHCGMFREMKIALFTEAIQIINKRKTYSICTHLQNLVFRELYTNEGINPPLSPYALAFIGVAIRNTRLARDIEWPDRMPYLVDQGNPHAEQLRFGHFMITQIEKHYQLPFTGSLTFADDETNPALQASDVIAWTSRRQLSGDGLNGEFSPLSRLFEKRYSSRGIAISPHIDYEVTPEMTKHILASSLVSSREAQLQAMERYRRILTGENDGNGRV